MVHKSEGSATSKNHNLIFALLVLLVFPHLVGLLGSGPHLVG